MTSARTKAKRLGRLKPVGDGESPAAPNKLEWGWVGSLAIALGIVTSMLYSAGKLARDQFLLTLGVLPDNIPIPFQEYVHFGLLIQLETITRVWGSLISLLLIVVCVAFVWYWVLHTVDDWVVVKGRAHRHKAPAWLLPIANRIERTSKRANPYLAATIALFLLLLVLGTYSFFVDDARQKGERHARDILLEARKGDAARMGYAAVIVRKLSGEEIAKGFAIFGTEKSILLVSGSTAGVTSKLYQLSPDMVVVGVPKN